VDQAAINEFWHDSRMIIIQYSGMLIVIALRHLVFIYSGGYWWWIHPGFL